MSILIIEATFYQDISQKLSNAAIAVLQETSYPYHRLSVPGCFEIPPALAMAIDSARYCGYIALGCVIRGETSHYDYVCNESARGLRSLAQKYRLALGYGIITANTADQAYARCEDNTLNVGRRAAISCLGMLELKQSLA